MKRQRVFRLTEQGYQDSEVICYAPGDGELSFVARDLTTNCATNPSPTEEECIRAIAHRPEYEVYKNGPYFRARRRAITLPPGLACLQALRQEQLKKEDE